VLFGHQFAGGGARGPDGGASDTKTASSSASGTGVGPSPGRRQPSLLYVSKPFGYSQELLYREMVRLCRKDPRPLAHALADALTAAPGTAASAPSSSGDASAGVQPTGAATVGANGSMTLGDGVVLTREQVDTLAQSIVCDLFGRQHEQQLVCFVITLIRRLQHPPSSAPVSSTASHVVAETSVPTSSTGGDVHNSSTGSAQPHAQSALPSLSQFLERHSLMSRVLHHFLQLIGEDYLGHVVRPVIVRILSDDQINIDLMRTRETPPSADGSSTPPPGAGVADSPRRSPVSSPRSRTAAALVAAGTSRVVIVHMLFEVTLLLTVIPCVVACGA